MRLWHSDSPNAKQLSSGETKNQTQVCWTPEPLLLTTLHLEMTYLVDLHIVGAQHKRITVTAGDQVRRPDRFLSVWESEQPPGKKLTLNGQRGKKHKVGKETCRQPVCGSYRHPLILLRLICIIHPSLFFQLPLTHLSYLMHHSLMKSSLSP